MIMNCSLIFSNCLDRTAVVFSLVFLWFRRIYLAVLGKISSRLYTIFFFKVYISLAYKRVGRTKMLNDHNLGFCKILEFNSNSLPIN